jgi:dTDP-4-dehydrorhamnose 3,5-epimerase
MEFIATKFNGAFILKPLVHSDDRGFFLESYSSRDFIKAGISVNFVQDNHSMSVEPGVLRGLHFQNPPMAQSKLIRATKGAIFDVIVDLRKNSPTFGQWESFELSDTNFLSLFVPHGFAHGFCTLGASTEVMYKVDNFYSPEHDSGIRWEDPTLGIPWPNKDPVLSGKDKLLPFFGASSFPF